MGLPLRFLLFFLVTGALTVAGHVYLYRRLFQDTGVSPGVRRAGLWVMAGLALLMLASRVITRIAPSPFTFAVATSGWIWMGLVTYLLLTMLGLSGARWLWGFLKRRRVAAAQVSEERRQFLARVTAGSALAATATVSSFGVWRVFHEPVLSEVAVQLPGLPRVLDGFTIVQVSDVHVGAIIQRRFMDEMVRRCNALRPDLVAITGDLVDGSVRELAAAVSALQNLRSRHGSYFVTGNHEYYSGDEEWSEALTRMGIGVLRNRTVSVGEPSASFDLVGVDDWAARRAGFERGYDLEAATRGRRPDRGAVLLAHQPANWREAAQAGMGLQLSGHTHGGQFFPFTLAVSAIWEHEAGLYQEGGRSLYVSRGTGFWGPPLRVGSPPEIVKVTLLA